MYTFGVFFMFMFQHHCKSCGNTAFKQCASDEMVMLITMKGNFIP